MEESNSSKKMDRQRKKRYYNTIRSQIEFYLGDVNLSKDRFFNSILHESPYVDVNTILNCNKIKKLTTNPKDIVKCLKNSELLAVTEDETKIYRKVPVKPVTNADECTIYVEDLPPEIDHEWLKSVFKAYGDIVYVSVPRFKQSNKIKGFAFVQFDSSESAQNALKVFRSVNSCLSCNIAPSELRSVQTFEGEKDVVVIDHYKTDVEYIQCISEKAESAVEKEETEEEEEPQKKKRKSDKALKKELTGNDANIDKEDLGKENKNDAKSDDDQSKNEMIESEDYCNEKHLRKRKRKRNKKSESVQTYGMQILSKQEWKKLRNKYLEEQRKKMHELKEQLRKTRWANSEESVSVKEEELPSEECRVKFTPGVIIKLKLDQPVKNVKNFKTEVKRYVDVEYIDVNENNLEAYFRCSSNEVANQVMALNRWPNMEILRGQEESEYWEKIKEDRKKKFEGKIRCKTRGKTKLIKKVEVAMVKHIKFPE